MSTCILHTVNNRNRYKCVKIEHWVFKMLNVLNFACWINLFSVEIVWNQPILTLFEHFLLLRTQNWSFEFLQIFELIKCSMFHSIHWIDAFNCSFESTSVVQIQVINSKWADFKLILYMALGCINTYNPLMRNCFKINFASTFWKFH